VSAALTLTAGDNISITGNNASKSITIGVTGINLSGIANGTSNVNIAVADGNVITAVNGNTVLTVTGTGANVTGYLDVSGTITGGNIITAGQTNINDLEISGNITGNLLPAANITYDLGSDTQRWNDIYLSNSTIYLGNAQISANATSLILTNPEGAQTVFSGAESDLFVETITATGNVNAGNLITSGNVVAAEISSSGEITAVGNVSGNNIVATSDVIGVQATFTGNIESNNAVITNNISASTGTFTGNVSGSTFSGNISGDTGVFTGNVSTDTLLGNISGDTGVFTGNVSTDTLLGNISGDTGTFTGNVSGDAFIGNISGDTGVFTGNISADTLIGNISGDTGVFTGNISSDTLLGNVSGDTGTFTGNVSSDTFIGNVAGGTATFTGNIVAGNISTNGVFDVANTVASGNILANNLISNNDVTTATVTASGNISGNNVNATNSVTTTTIIASGNIDGANVNATNLFTATGGTFTGNVSVGNIDSSFAMTTEVLSASGNVTANNAIITGEISGTTIAATGNITADNVIATTNVEAAGIISSGNVDAATAVNTDLISGDSLQIITTGDLGLQPAGNITVSGSLVRNLASPVAAQDAATKQYVDDSVSSGITIHDPVQLLACTFCVGNNYTQGGTVATVTETVAGNTVVFSSAIDPQVNDQYWFDNSFNGILGNVPYFVVSAPNTSAAVLTTVYDGEPVANITSGSGLTESVRINSGQGATITNAGANVRLTIDSTPVTTGNRVLLSAQTDPAQNGVYDVTEQGAPDSPGPGAQWILTRSSDMDTYIPNDINGFDAGDYFYVQDGVLNKGEAWVMTAPIGPFIIGLANVTFTQFSASQVYSANTQAGLDLTGVTFAAKVDNITTAFDGGGNIVVKASADFVTPKIGNATGNSLSLTGNGLLSATTVEASGNVLAGNLNSNASVTAVTFVASGNSQSNNAIITNGVSAATGSFSGNITAGNVNSNSAISTITIIATGNIDGANVNATSAITAGTTVIATGNVSGGNITTAGSMDATGNITGGNITTAGEVTATGNVSGGNITTAGSMDATGNITGGNIGTAGLLSGSRLIVQGNISENVGSSFAGFTPGDPSGVEAGLVQSGSPRSNSLSYIGVFNNAQILDDVVLDYYTHFQATGDDALIGANSSITNQTGVYIGLQNTGTINTGLAINVDNLDPTNRAIYSIGNAASFLGGDLSVAGNVDGGNVNTTGDITAGSISATGNVNAYDIVSTTNVSGVGAVFSGNITGSYFIGNGSQLTGISTSTSQIFNGTSNVDIAAANADITMSVAGVSNVVVVSTDGITVTGNVIGNGIPITTVSSSPPSNPEQGDIWIDTDTGVQLIYFNDGSSNQWAEMEAATSISIGSGSANVDLSAVDQDIIPAANATYSLGNATNRWANLFLVGNTIDLGGAQIKADASSGAIALIPAATANVPNPTALVISVTGAVNTVETAGGEISGNAIANAASVTPPVTEMFNQLSGNYVIGNNYNALTVGPVTINTGGEITVPTGSNWMIL